MTPHQSTRAQDGESRAEPSERELRVARRIADRTRSAASPVEVYRVALATLTPFVNATFASVFLRDPENPGLLRLACAYNWPQSSARFLADLRIREGLGPTGRTVRTGRVMEVTDVFEDPSFVDWQGPARELGFASMISIPLIAGGEVLGAMSFYFKECQHLDEDARALLSLVADQLAAAAQGTRSEGAGSDGGQT